MKVLYTIIALCCLCAVAVADVSEMRNANQATVQWDAVVDATAYRVYSRSVAGGEQTLLAQVSETSYTISFDADTSVIMGVQSVRVVTVAGVEQPVEATSDIAWSDVAANCLEGKTFGLYYVRPPDMPGGLR